MDMERNSVTVGVIGPGGDLCSPELYEFARRLGRALGERHYAVVCGGMGGMMEAVCRNSLSPGCIAGR